MLYTIVMVACAAVTGCKEVPLPVTLQAQMPAMQFIEAQAIVSQWADLHPGITVETFRLVRGHIL